jgi:hypothetical protein
MRPKPFTEAVRIARRKEQNKLNGEPIDVAFADDEQLGGEALREASRPDKRTDNEKRRNLQIATDLAPILHLPDELVSELKDILIEVRWHWRDRQNVMPGLPNLGGVQPTHGEMRATLQAGFEHAERLRGWYRSLPAALLSETVVTFAEGGAPLGVVIERLPKVLEQMADEHKVLGRPPGRRVAAQAAAAWLIAFVDRRAPKLSRKQRKKFVFLAMRELGVDCPSLNDDPGDFAVWFAEVEAMARPANDKM